MKIEFMSLDFETRSSIDITKAGVYKYAESPDFDILLFGVPLTAVQLLCMTLPAETKYRRKSSKHCQMIPLPSGHITLPLKKSVSMAETELSSVLFHIQH